MAKNEAGGKRERIRKALRPVGDALDNGALRMLQDTNPELATAVEEAVADDVPPDEFRRFVLEETGQEGLANFVMRAARAARASAGKAE